MENMRKFLGPLTDLHTLVTDALKAMDQSLIKADKSFSESNHRIVSLPTTSFHERFIAWPTQAVNTAGDKWSVDRARGLEKRYSLPENAMEFETDAAAREFLSAYLVGLRSVMKKRFRAMNMTHRYQIDGSIPLTTSVTHPDHPEEQLYINWAVRDTVNEKLVCVIGGGAGMAIAVLVMHALNAGEEEILAEAHNIGSQLNLLRLFNDIAKGTNETDFRSNDR